MHIMNDTQDQGVIADSPFYSNAIFFIEIDKVKPNPFQPRRDFDQDRLLELAESIRMYGILQPLVVTRKEVVKPDGGLATEYELIAGERRLRASKLAGLREVPAIIRAKEDDDRVKLELAIIENLQREDISPVDKARAFKQLVDKFGLTHGDVAKKVGKSREYVSNSIRILGLPEEMLVAISEGKITEGHSRPLLMLSDRPEEQNVLFKDIMLRKLTVRDAEKISRKIATERVRKLDLLPDPELLEIEHEIGTLLGTRVNIAKKEEGGRIQIDFFNQEDLKHIVDLLLKRQAGQMPVSSVAPAVAPAAAFTAAAPTVADALTHTDSSAVVVDAVELPPMSPEVAELVAESMPEPMTPAEAIQEIAEDKFADQQITIDTPSYGDSDDEDLYSMKSFSL
jgi:ParB family transcriptional regulator, chromosome partitioning protein